ncbi:hypothetical protein LJB92_03065 [Bacteroidales bacterium OttesenSCG-928-M06]|nr:hypothetical protein [Bacteroidales bacterium OttesenSCG-928-M06]
MKKLIYMIILCSLIGGTQDGFATNEFAQEQIFPTREYDFSNKIFIPQSGYNQQPITRELGDACPNCGKASPFFDPESGAPCPFCNWTTSGDSPLGKGLMPVIIFMSATYAIIRAFSFRKKKENN